MLPLENSNANSSASAASPSAGTLQGSKSASLSGRKIVYLPADQKYRNQFTDLGISWEESVDKGALLAKALLPAGWEAIDTPHPYHHFFIIYDQDKLPRIDIFVKDTHEYARVTFFNSEESVRKKRIDDEEKKLKADKAAKDAETLKEILSNRFTGWSTDCPFGVFFVLDLKDHGMSASITAQRRSCQGFFKTEEIANKAKKLLGNQAGLFDCVFVNKVDQSNLHLVKKGGYEIVNGFNNKDWWQKEGGITFGPPKKIDRLAD